jgi:hypothetical protein
MSYQLTASHVKDKDFHTTKQPQQNDWQISVNKVNCMKEYKDGKIIIKRYNQTFTEE